MSGLFTKEEEEKIEKIFKIKFAYIDLYENSCVFAEQGFLDCYDEVLYTKKPKELEDYADKDDDEILKKLNENWFIYGVR